MTSNFIENFSRMTSQKQEYALRMMPSHLAAAEMTTALRDVLVNLDFLQAKVDKLGPHPLIEDYDLVLRNESAELRLEDNIKPLDSIQGAIRLSAQVLSQTSAQLCEQLLGRLLGHASPEIQELLKTARHRNPRRGFVLSHVISRRQEDHSCATWSGTRKE